MLFKQPSSRVVRGFTLTEAAIVLGIVGLILSAIWVAAGSVYNNYRVGKSSEQLLTMVQSMRSVHSSHLVVDTNFNGEQGAVLLAEAGGVPTDMIEYKADGVSVNTVRDVWGGTVEVTHTDDNNGLTDGAFAIRFTKVPQAACMTLLTSNTGAGRDTGLIGAGNSITTATSFPVSISDAKTNCPTTTGGGNDVIFTFRLKA